MLAVDTNVVIRYLANDDARQSPQARTLVDKNEVMVTATVLLEAVWVLRSVYKYSAQEVVAALKAFSGLPTIVLDQPSPIARAFNWASQGMDFADALHMATTRNCTSFASFDRDLAKIASRVADIPVRAP